jgi:hypothetical protein
MKNNLHLVQKTARLSCTWIPTGDARMPFTCVWVEAQTSQPTSVAPSNDEIGRLRQCA